MGGEIPLLATGFDSPFDDSHLCIGVVSRRTFKKVDESSPWNWVGNIRLGHLSILWRLVGSPQGEKSEAIVRAVKGHGM